jgi:hypothetical protein
MIDAELFREEGILTVFPTGALAERDFTALAGLVDPFIEAKGALNGLMVIAEHFPGWENFASLITHIRFVRNHERAIRRVAVVTDSPLLGLMPALARHFVDAEVQSFPFAQRDAAFDWLKGKQRT